MRDLHVSTGLMDDRKFQDFIGFMQRYAKHLLFINTTEDNVNHTWENFFKNDILLLAANVATKDAEELRSIYKDLNKKFEQNKTIDNFTELVAFTFSGFEKINTWYKLSAGDNILRQSLATYIQSYLQKEFEIISVIIGQIRERIKGEFQSHELINKIEQIDETLAKMDPIWRQSKKDTLLSDIIFSGDTDQQKLTRASLVLDKTFNTVFHATEKIIKRCSDYFEAAIRLKQNRQDHYPHVALIIAFIKLYEYVKGDFNNIPQRLLDFYYREVLKIKEKEPVPDETFVVFELAKGFDTCEVKKGTQLSAGKDKQNKELIYETEKDIVINKAQVDSLKTILIEKDSQDKILHYYADTILPVNGQNGKVYRDIFGEKKKQAETTVGFAIASTQFYLAKSQRKITIVFELDEDIDASEFHTDIITLKLTGEKGWLSSDNPDDKISITSLNKINPKEIELIFSISIAQPSSIVAFDPKIHDGNFLTVHPVLQCLLKFPSQFEDSTNNTSVDTDEITQINTLQKIKVNNISITAEVGNIDAAMSFDGVKDLLLENHEAILDNKKPFYPFTVVPKIGSSFYIGCNDLYYKEIEKLSLNIEWMLPDNFSTYYEKYPPPYDANKFTASLNILIDKNWKKINDIPLVDADTSEPKFRSVKIDFTRIKYSETGEQNQEVLKFDTSKKDHTLKLKLNYPDFGHGVYPQLITSSVMEKATSKETSLEKVKKRLHGSFGIELPPDMDDRSGSLKVVVYDVLEMKRNDEEARNMIIKGLRDIIRQSIRLRETNDQNEDISAENANTEIVTDYNLVNRIFSWFGISKRIDRDKDTVSDVTKGLTKKTHVEFISLISGEVNNTINKTVVKIVDRILEARRAGNTEGSTIAAILNEEFKEANEILNDMIAKKIAIVLSTNEIPPPPYSPLINTISLSYLSTKKYESGDDQIFHITPFGTAEIDLSLSEENTLIHSNQIFPKSLINIANIELQGILFIGIKDILPKQNLSLLIRLAEGIRVKDSKPPDVSWFYSRNNEWVELKEDHLISDSTYGLQTTGVIEFSIPADANNKSTLFNEVLYWLCAGVKKETDAFPYLVDVKAQATIVRFKDSTGNSQHLKLPLEAEKIKTLIDDIPRIKKVSQPLSSFNGKAGENERDYYTRVSERLRHKSRAIANWDFERLVLEEFPSLYKVKCINNYVDGHFAVGHVTVVPIADLRNKNYAGSNILIPKINYIDLKKIEDFLHSKSSPFARIHAINPKLEHVLISCKVKFNAGVDKGFYLQKLNDDLIDFLTPWATGDMDAVSFSAKIFASSIINFIDRQSYVNYVADLVMQQYIENDKGERQFVTDSRQLTSLVETELTTDHSILVSAPKHEIDVAE